MAAWGRRVASRHRVGTTWLPRLTPRRSLPRLPRQAAPWRSDPRTPTRHGAGTSDAQATSTLVVPADLLLAVEPLNTSMTGCCDDHLNPPCDPRSVCSTQPATSTPSARRRAPALSSAAMARRDFIRESIVNRPGMSGGGRVARSSHLNLLVSGTRIQKLRRRGTRDTPKSPDTPGRFIE